MFARSVMSLHGGSTDELCKVLLIQSPVWILRILNRNILVRRTKLSVLSEHIRLISVVLLLSVKLFHFTLVYGNVFMKKNFT